ncbi:integral membrane sensor signal transduction histidine kinase [Methylocella silvestris BL2]|uniref:histidine kinase n=2 Tax=Methylocella silvestris TaxID=199596 RepID=B8ES99_METSB|nr:integral membrane sensor signal transduction histidine kinase [Methylocella silvestris BL2]
MPMRISDLFRTASFRLAVLFAFAVTAATTVVFLFIYWHVATFDVRRVDVRLSEEVARAAAEPDDQLRRQLRRRLTSDLRKLDYVGLFDAQGKPVFGNVGALPEALPIDGEPHPIEVAPLSGRSGTEPALLAARRRANGGVVLIGRSLYEVYALRRLVVRALALGIAPTILSALIIGLIFSLRTVRRLRSVNEAIFRIMQGDLQDRLPVGPWKDDVDNIANGVNLMLDEIVRLLDQIRSVSDNIAHDLRSPLAITRLSLERGLAAAAEKDLRLATERALAELDRALTTVSALLRISEIELGRRRHEFVPIDLAEVCATAFELYEPLAEARSISFTLDAGRPAPLSGDHDLLVEAIANLLDNALKFAPENGIVRLSASVVSGCAEVAVCDNGPGVDPSERSEIFKRFYRSKSARAIPGTGLGLNLAATIFSLHGLDLKVTDNHPGARFVASQRLPTSS